MCCKSCTCMETAQSWLEVGGTQMSCVQYNTHNAIKSWKSASKLNFLGILFYKNWQKMESIYTTFSHRCYQYGENIHIYYSYWNINMFPSSTCSLSYLLWACRLLWRNCGSQLCQTCFPVTLRNAEFNEFHRIWFSLFLATFYMRHVE